MDINSLIKNLDISNLKVWFLKIFNKEALIDYLIERANNAVNSLIDDNKLHISTVRAAMLTVNGWLYRFRDYIPSGWKVYVENVNTALKGVYEATEDYTIDSAEAKAAISYFKQRYSEYRAD